MDEFKAILRIHIDSNKVSANQALNLTLIFDSPGHTTVAMISVILFLTLISRSICAIMRQRKLNGKLIVSECWRD
eukprot:88826-Amorphochlora_amoeboformis.AAC.1